MPWRATIWRLWFEKADVQICSTKLFFNFSQITIWHTEVLYGELKLNCSVKRFEQLGTVWTKLLTLSQELLFRIQKPFSTLCYVQIKVCDSRETDFKVFLRKSEGTIFSKHRLSSCYTVSYIMI